MSFPPSPLHFQAWTQVLTSLLNAKRLSVWVCEHACTCVTMCIFYAINIWRVKQFWVTHPSVFLLTSSFSMSSWSPFSSGLISLCIFSHHSEGAQDSFCCFHSTGTRQHLCSHRYFSICLSISIAFSLWGWIFMRCHIHKNCDFQSLESRRFLSALLSWLLDPFTLPCSTRWPCCLNWENEENSWKGG